MNCTEIAVVASHKNLFFPNAIPTWIRAQRLERIVVGFVRATADETLLELESRLVAGLLPEVPAERLAHLVNHATALVQDVQTRDEALQTTHLVHVAVGVAIVRAHRLAVLHRPAALQLFVIGAE